jgi:feruloyl esterase
VRSASPHRGPWPKVSIWQGSADQTVNPRNSTEIAKQWTAIHKAGRKPEREEKQSGHLRRTWNNAAGEPVVEEYIVAGLGHGTPLATGAGAEHFGATAPYLLETGLSSSYRIVQFWGIARHVPAGEVKPPQEVQPVSPVASPTPAKIALIPAAPQPRPAPPGPSPRHDIGAIINKALKSAGLLK